jgi:hypothetical protein
MLRNLTESLETVLVIPYLSPEFITALIEIFAPKQVTNKYLSNGTTSPPEPADFATQYRVTVKDNSATPGT